MKSFGVRLAAGGVTILLGAFAAVQAQKDRQTASPESWSAATPPSLEQTPEPISVPANASWLGDPDVASSANAEEGRTADSDNQATESFGEAPGIRLVQHTEPVDAAGVSPESMQDHGDSPQPGFQPDFDSQSPAFDPQASGFVPDASDTSDAENPAEITAPSWNLPAEAMENQSAATPSAATMTLPVIAAQSDTITPAANLPEMQFGEAPAMSSSAAAAGGGVANPETPDAAQGSYDATASGPSAFPNSLRVDASSANQLRGAESMEVTPEGNYAVAAGAAMGAAAGAAIGSAASSFDSDGLGSPAANMQPGSYGPSAGLGQPTGISAEDSPGFPPSAPPGFADAGGSADAGQLGAGAPDASGLGHSTFGAPDLRSQPSHPQSFDTPPSFADLSAMPHAAAPAGSEPSMSANPNSPYPGGPAARVASLPGRADAPLGLGSFPQVASGQDGMTHGYPQANMGQPQPAMSLAIDPNLTADSPGDRRLEGVQSPSIVIQKRAPGEVKVGKPASFVIHVQNVGSVEALDVTVHDQVPRGMRLVDASPTPVMQGDRLLWQLGAMPAGDERTVTMQLIPEQEGELGSVARVTFEAAASVRTMSTRPELKIVQRVPAEKVLIGQQLEIDLEVSNPGTGEATGVMMQEDVPEGLEHPKGRQLDNLLGTLAPGEVRRQVLRLRAVAPGVIQNQIRLIGDDGLAAEHTVEVEVVAPELQVALSGPSMRFLERQATYEVEIANVGTTTATNIEIAVQLDRGLTFVSTESEGQYDQSRHTVYWSLAQLPEGASGKVPLTLLPVEVGDQAINLAARADLGIVAKNQRTIAVDSFAELSFQITNPGGPIEVGSETVYEVKVQNSGSRTDTNVQVRLQLPPGLKLLSADGDAGTDGRGLVAFQPRAELAAGGEMSYRLRVQGVTEGTHLVKAIVTSDQSTVPVTKEESTRVYSDR